MWIITRDGFVSLVEHKTDPTLIRARARRRDHLIDTFDLRDDDVIDLGVDAPDYRWHAELPRTTVIARMIEQIEDLDYSSHVKEEVSGADNEMYRAMLDTWTAFNRLQNPLPPPSYDWWNNGRNEPPAAWEGYDWPERTDAEEALDLAAQADDLATRMLRTEPDDDVATYAEGFGENKGLVEWTLRDLPADDHTIEAVLDALDPALPELARPTAALTFFIPTDDVDATLDALDGLENQLIEEGTITADQTEIGAHDA